MYGRGLGSGAVIVGGGTGGLAATGASVMMAVVAALVLVVAGLFLLRWGKVRRHLGTRP